MDFNNMDIVESIKKDKAYMKCKLIVKNWEKEFKNEHSRTPSKFDIKEAPANIKYAYKKYFQLKSAFLENSLSVCDYEEEALISPECSTNFEHLRTFTSNPQPDTIPDLPSAQQLHNLIKNSKAKTDTEQLSPFVENLSKKLFNNRKFNLRNPRKVSLSKSQSIIEEPQDNSISNQFQSSIDKDFIEIGTFDDSGLNKYNSFNDITTKKNYLQSDNLPKITNSTPTRHISEAWLNRAIELGNIEKHKSEGTPHFGISNIVISNKEKNDYVENSESDDDIEVMKLKPALKKLKPDKDTQKKIRSPDIHFNKNTQPETIQTKTARKNKKDSGSNIQQQPPDIMEYVPFGLDNDVNPRHHDFTNILNNVKLPNPTGKQTLDDNEENKLLAKIKNGTLNDNFVKINIEKKVFVRGKKNQSFSKYKKKQWKDKKALHAAMEFPENGKISCFKCGLGGHMARYCTAHRGDTLLPLEGYDDNDLPTLEDMQTILTQKANDTSDEQTLALSLTSSSKVPDSFLKLIAETSEKSDIKPIYDHLPDKTPEELYDCIKMFGHNAFKPGQENAIIRILCGKSTLLILSTGGGKSLCYQLPAYIYSKHYNCITLVISPLVSLMEDQVLSMPDFLKAGCLHTNQSPTQRTKVIQCIKDGEINILLISPEALISGDNSNGFGSLFKSLPKIAFACIDEAHCVSQWSHNFRPSYLMICRVLREKLKVNCILGLTATASQSTIKSVISHINIPDGLEGVIANPTLPDNLCLSVSFEKGKDKALISYLASDRISSFNSIIVYCIRRDECERIAAMLRSCLQVPNKVTMEKANKKRKRMSYIAEAYHAGMSAAQRKKIQKHFMDGSLRIIVATVAFGMGIDKSNIRCIIHYNMPSSFESYVQEVGRAGRDGQIAYCHVFMNNSNYDKNELLKHIHANTIDRPTIRRLLRHLFIPCECTSAKEKYISPEIENSTKCKGHEVGIPIESTVEELDLPSENIATLLCYIELHPKHYIKVLNNAYITCKIHSYAGPKKIFEAAKSCPPLAMAYLLESKKNSDIMKNSSLEFNVIEVAAAIGWESGVTKYHLKNLEWVTENGASKRSTMKVEFHTLGFRIKASGDLESAELDGILDDIHNSVISQEKAKLYQLEEINLAFSKLGNYSIENQLLSDNMLNQQSNELKQTIRDYFQRSDTIPNNVTLQERPIDVERVAADVRALISTYKDCDFTGRSVARIFQGISSPNYPALVWGRCKYWRLHIHQDFYGLLKVATEQIIQMTL